MNLTTTARNSSLTASDDTISQAGKKKPPYRISWNRAQASYQNWSANKTPSARPHWVEKPRMSGQKARLKSSLGYQFNDA